MNSLALGYNQLKDEPEVKDLFGAIRTYYQDLKDLRLDDSAVKRISSKDWKNVYNFIFSLFMLFVSGIFVTKIRISWKIMRFLGSSWIVTYWTSCFINPCSQ